MNIRVAKLKIKRPASVGRALLATSFQGRSRQKEKGEGKGSRKEGSRERVEEGA